MGPVGEHELVLSDGSGVSVRPILPSDREALSTMYAGLSDESRYRRFMYVHPELPQHELDYLTEIDHSDHEALVAFAPDGSMVGVVRYVRTGPDEAEPAMLVTDGWQGRGLGGQMLELLADHARAQSITRFRAPVLATNETGMRSLDRLGPSIHHPVGSEVEIEIELGELRAEPRPGRGRVPLRPASVLAAITTRPEPIDPSKAANVFVVGADGDLAAKVVDSAAELARSVGAALVLVRAVGLADRSVAELDLELLASRIRGEGVDVESLVRPGGAATAIVEAAVEYRARMVVIGASRRTRSTALIGAVGDLVTRQVPCDVLVVRP